MVDLTTAVALSLPCNQCGGRYEVSLHQVLVAHEAMKLDCSVNRGNDCPPLVISALIDRATIEDLQRAWLQIEGRARAIGATLAVRGLPGEELT